MDKERAIELATAIIVANNSLEDIKATGNTSLYNQVIVWLMRLEECSTPDFINYILSEQFQKDRNEKVA